MKAVAIKAKKELDISKKEVGIQFQINGRIKNNICPLILLSLSLLWLIFVSGGKPQWGDRITEDREGENEQLNERYHPRGWRL